MLPTACTIHRALNRLFAAPPSPGPTDGSRTITRPLPRDCDLVAEARSVVRIALDSQADAAAVSEAAVALVALLDGDLDLTVTVAPARIRVQVRDRGAHGTWRGLRAGNGGPVDRAHPLDGRPAARWGYERTRDDCNAVWLELPGHAAEAR